MSAELLAGLLAVKLDFITRDELVAAVRGWSAEKARPLADWLALSADRRQLLAALVAEQLKAKTVPEVLAEMSSIDWARDALKDVPDAEIERTIHFIPAADRIVMQTGASAAIQGLPSRSGSRFRIIRPHARGGRGEVYVAHDTELSREVALKEIQPQHSGDESTRGRFVLEAEVTGGLEHPNIVPVYGLGTYADGRPYYAMRFIRGDSLKDAIERFYSANSTALSAERNIEFRNLLKRFVDVCNAIAYAHSRGILHRDLKPGNIMLGKYGETLVVDWGLAKSLASGGRESPDSTEPGERHLTPSSGSYAETQTGSIVGTPAFMSPEQAAAKFEELGPAADVYSLGATLYVILTGKVPFAGPISDLLEKVEAGEFAAPKQVQPQTPAALNAVVLKAMAKEPSERYATATELAQEIERYLADEPVLTLSASNNLAAGYFSTGKYELALPLFEEVLRIRKAKDGPHHPETIRAMGNCAAINRTMGRLEAARGLYEETLAQSQKQFGPNHPETIIAVATLARLYFQVGRRAEASELSRAMLNSMEAIQYDHRHAGPMMADAMMCLEGNGEWGEAEGWRRKWVAVLRTNTGPLAARLPIELEGLCSNLLQQAKWPEAEVVGRECHAIRQKQSPVMWSVGQSASMLGESLAAQKKYAEAEPLLLAGFAGLKACEKQIPPNANRLREAAVRVVDFYTATNQPEKAAEWQSKLPREHAPMPRLGNRPAAKAAASPPTSASPRTLPRLLGIGSHPAEKLKVARKPTRSYGWAWEKHHFTCILVRCGPFDTLSGVAVY